MNASVRPVRRRDERTDALRRLANKIALALAWILSSGFSAPGISPAGQAITPIPSLSRLLESESRLLEKAAIEERPAIEERFGADPFKILHLRDRNRFLILLRNRSEVVLADDSLNPLKRLPAPRSPAGWALAEKNFLFVGGELSSEVYLYEITGSELRLRSRLSVDGVSVRDLVYVSSLRSLFLLDDFDRRLHQWILPAAWWRQERIEFKAKTFPTGAGPIEIRHVENHLVINLLLDHTLWIVPLKHGAPDFSSASRITHDGPIWSYDAQIRGGFLMIAAAGVEDRPLDRRGEEFGHIDSFLFFYRVPRDGASGHFRWRPVYRERSDRFLRKNLSALGIVTPKALRFAASSDRSTRLWIAAFGSQKLARFEVGPSAVRITGSFTVPPGTTDFVVVGEAEGAPTLILTNTLLDRLYRLDKSGWSPIARPPDFQPRISRESRLGEMLFFTTLMAPYNRADGRLSRFTCEACHYEGNFDGRVHYSGRGHVFAATKPARGLANNVPLFSRAGDKSLASMVLAEFRVANQKRQDFFSVDVRQFPWLKEIEGTPEVVDPAALRHALLAFFVDFDHRPNPLRVSGRPLDPRALAGLELFREKCEHCHRAAPSTRVKGSLPFESWASWISTGTKDLVWGAPFYAKTGIKPYVHRAGARVPSLRRVWQKYPYFTDGSSRTLADVLARFRYRDLTAWHHAQTPAAESNPQGVQSLTAEEISLLEELLRYY